MLKFIFTLVAAGISVFGASLLWPRLTNQPRPPMLQEVHDTGLQTAAGQQAAQALGVSDEANITPLNGAEILAGAVGALKEAAQERAQTIMVTQLTQQLSEDQKQQLQELICKPEDQ